MYRYAIVSNKDVPELDDLELVQEYQASSHQDVDQIVFACDLSIPEIKQYEPIVGLRCRVTRTNDDGQTQERGGAVNQVTPFVRVSLDGGGWQ